MQDNRLKHILISLIIIFLLMVYADFNIENVASIPMKELEASDNLYVDTSRIWREGDFYFQFMRSDDTIMTIHLPYPSPFKKGDLVSFHAINRGGYFILEEYHIWETSLQFFLKAFFSAIPLLLIIFWILGEFQYQKDTKTFRRKE